MNPVESYAIGEVAGGIFGGVCIIVIIIVLAICLACKKKRDAAAAAKALADGVKIQYDANGQPIPGEPLPNQETQSTG